MVEVELTQREAELKLDKTSWGRAGPSPATVEAGGFILPNK